MKKANPYVIVGMILAVVVVLSVLGFSAIKPLIQSTTGEGIPKISAQGDSELSIMPDEAIIRIKVETKEKTAKEAQDKNSEIMTVVQSALKRAGVASDDIESDQYNLYPYQEWDPVTRKSVQKGYRLYHTIKVTTSDLDKVGEFITVAVDAGADGVENVQFDLSDDKKAEVKKEALQQASQNAKEKAKAVADGLGVRLGELLSIQESSFNYGPVYRAMGAEMTVSMDDEKMAPPVPIQPEQLTIRASVSVSYKIA
ncbi:SIMPL domain-containing protein [Candidatus Woesearchaeota archaeon]|nr:SIMPL domain-containing protein [Candidatus Woesearchaeota archaeon]